MSDDAREAAIIQELGRVLGTLFELHPKVARIMIRLYQRSGASLCDYGFTRQHPSDPIQDAGAPENEMAPRLSINEPQNGAPVAPTKTGKAL